MLFNSFKFLIFFPIVVTLFYLIPQRFRWVLLLGASYYFYMSWKPEYIVFILLSTVISYFTAIFISKTSDYKIKKVYITLSLISNLGLLFIFKYYNFFNNSLSAVLQSFNVNIGLPNFKLLLPVGISFYTFQTLSYTIDVYRGKLKPEKHFGIYALFVSFFPQLVAGPIERSENLLPQFYEEHKPDYDRIISGLKVMGWGFFKKVVIADRAAILVNQVYNNAHDYNGVALITATLFFAFQIYCDFSGYSDIAIGLARLMGFNLMKNFNRPYFSKSIPEFWRRWHISLSTWFKDYLYIPLGGNRVSRLRWFFNLFLTFMVSGIWHGANWTFIVWGFLHGIYQIIAILTKDFRKKFVSILGLDKVPALYGAIQVVITFSLVCFAWIFFRANSISDANYVITHLFTGLGEINSLGALKQSLTGLGLGRFEFIVAILSILFMLMVEFFQERISITSFLSRKPIVVRWAIYYMIIFAIIILGVYGYEEQSQFIYFQF